MINMETNKLLYILLLVLALAIVLISLLIPIDCQWFTIVAGVGCGALASVVVAWLINVADCKRHKAELEKKKSLIFSGYKSGVEQLRFRIAHIAHLKCKDNEKHTLREWLEKLSDIETYKLYEYPEKMRASTYQMIVNKLDTILPILTLLQQQYPLLIEADIIDDSKFPEHIDIQIGACEDAINEFCGTELTYYNCEIINDIVCLFVENYIEFFKPTNMRDKYSFDEP